MNQAASYLATKGFIEGMYNLEDSYRKRGEARKVVNTRKESIIFVSEHLLLEKRDQ